MLEKIKKLELLGGKLIPGDMDSLVLYGCEEQGRLRSSSKALAKITVHNYDDLEYAIHDLTKEIEKFQSLSQTKKIVLVSLPGLRQSLIVKKYNEMLVYVDKIALLLQLQEAQLLKDGKALENIGASLVANADLLGDRIFKAEKLYAELSKQPFGENKDDMKLWIERLQRRIDDLRISHTVSMQGKAQVDLMISNYARLVDKIIAALSGTIPLWRNQITLLLGIEHLNQNAVSQEKLCNMMRTYYSEGNKIIKKHHINKEKIFDIEKIQKTNDALSKMLSELKNLEEERSDIENSVMNILQ